jgi:hypothetical protein
MLTNLHEKSLGTNEQIFENYHNLSDEDTVQLQPYHGHN